MTKIYSITTDSKETPNKAGHTDMHDSTIIPVSLPISSIVARKTRCGTPYSIAAILVMCTVATVALMFHIVPEIFYRRVQHVASTYDGDASVQRHPQYVFDATQMGDRNPRNYKKPSDNHDYDIEIEKNVNNINNNANVNVDSEVKLGNESPPTQQDAIKAIETLLRMPNVKQVAVVEGQQNGQDDVNSQPTFQPNQPSSLELMQYRRAFMNWLMRRELYRRRNMMEMERERLMEIEARRQTPQFMMRQTPMMQQPMAPTAPTAPNPYQMLMMVLQQRMQMMRANQLTMLQRMRMMQNPPFGMQPHMPMMQNEQTMMQRNMPMMQNEQMLQQNMPMMPITTQQRIPMMQNEQNMMQQRIPMMQNEQNMMQQRMPMMQNEQNMMQQRMRMMQNEQNMMQQRMPMMQNEQNMMQQRMPMMQNEQNMMQQRMPMIQNEQNMMQQRMPMMQNEQNMMQQRIQMSLPIFQHVPIHSITTRPSMQQPNFLYPVITPALANQIRPNEESNTENDVKLAETSTEINDVNDGEMNRESDSNEQKANNLGAESIAQQIQSTNPDRDAIFKRLRTQALMSQRVESVQTHDSNDTPHEEDSAAVTTMDPIVMPPAVQPVEQKNADEIFREMQQRALKIQFEQDKRDAEERQRASVNTQKVDGDAVPVVMIADTFPRRPISSNLGDISEETENTPTENGRKSADSLSSYFKFFEEEAGKPISHIESSEIVNEATTINTITEELNDDQSSEEVSDRSSKVQNLENEPVITPDDTLPQVNFPRDEIDSNTKSDKAAVDAPDGITNKESNHRL